MSFTGISERDREEMLREMGLSSLDELFQDIPESIALEQSPIVQPPSDEREVEEALKERASMTTIMNSFMGGGLYSHYVPAAVDELSGRSEFYTAYTPYQAEVSQGTLTAIFEFQTLICRLTGMEVANASMYDGATALAESILMLMAGPEKRKVLILSPLHPHFREVLDTYAFASGFEILEGREDIDISLEEHRPDVAIISFPDFHGTLTDLEEAGKTCQKRKVPLIVAVPEPLVLALVKPPGIYGADVVCGEGQSLGNYPGFGGPLLGFMATRKKHTRRLPGRIVGRTVDSRGKESYVLTLQTREQHIRRERATSNICTNQGLMALRSVIYMSLMGPGLVNLARFNHQLAVRLRNGLLDLGFSPFSGSPFFNEFTVLHPRIDTFTEEMRRKGFQPGILLELPDDRKALLICVTETSGEKGVNDYLKAAGEVLKK